MAQFRPISEARFKRAQARADRDPTPFANAVSFDRRTDVLRIDLNTGVKVSFPRNRIPHIGMVPDAHLASVTLEGGGTVISFSKANIYLSVAPLLEEFFGPMEWGRRERRAAASRENGKRGGRPKKVANANERILEDC